MADTIRACVYLRPEEGRIVVDPQCEFNRASATYMPSGLSDIQCPALLIRLDKEMIELTSPAFDYCTAQKIRPVIYVWNLNKKLADVAVLFLIENPPDALCKHYVSMTAEPVPSTGWREIRLVFTARAASAGVVSLQRDHAKARFTTINIVTRRSVKIGVPVLADELGGRERFVVHDIRNERPVLLLNANEHR